MASQYHEHINPDHGYEDCAAQPLYPGHCAQHTLIQRQGAHAAPGKRHRHIVGRHEQLHEFQYLFHHLGRHLQTGGKAGCQTCKQQEICNEKTCVGNLASLKYGRNIGKYSSNQTNGSHLKQHLAPPVHLREQSVLKPHSGLAQDAL